MPPLSQAEIETRIDQLLAQMTLAEKVGQMNQYSGFWEVTGPSRGSEALKRQHLRTGLVGSMLNVTSTAHTREAQRLAVEETRLGIPLIFGYDVIHGYQTMFPIPLGETASWDLAAIETSARHAAKEASAAGIHWTFAPMVDVARDARWGRVMEGAGEDPYLGSLVAVARVQGFQGDSLYDVERLAACAKHFAAYGFATAGRDYNTVDISDATLHDVVLPPFQAAAEAGVATFMNAFNEINGIPATGHQHLQRDLLKGAWNWPGFVVSDWASVDELIAHGYAEHPADAAKLAAQAGSDMDMEGYCYVPHLESLVKEGEVEMDLVDDAVRRILRVKFELGLFEDPYRSCNPDREKADIGSVEAHAAAREVAKKSIVLLQNDENILPLSPTGKIAVIGPLAADKDIPLGSWRAKALSNSAVSLLEGIQAAVGPQVEVHYAKGVDLAIGDRRFTQKLQINETDRSGFAEAVQLAQEADVVILALGEDCWQSGEGRSRTRIDLPGLQQELLEAIHAVNEQIVMVLMNGRPLVLTEVVPKVKGILETWFLGSQAGHAIADVLFGSYNPGGKLPMSFPRHVGQVPLSYAHKATGRGDETLSEVFWSRYIDEANSPLYPFGYGLSYTTFAYEDLTISSAEIKMSETLEVAITVRNTGTVAGEEVVQLYVRDVVGSRTRPVQELKGFQKIQLMPNAEQRVRFSLTAADLAFYTANQVMEAEAGRFEVMVGTNADAARELKTSFFLTP